MKTIKWFCKFCDSYKDNLSLKERNNERLQQIELQLDLLSNQIKEISTQVVEITNIKNDLLQIKNEILTASSKELNHSNSNQNQLYLEKKHNNEEYKYQFLIKGMKELENKNTVHNHDNNLEQVNGIIKYLTIGQINVCDIFRLGKYNKEKNRPILVKLSSIWDVRKILSKASTLKDYHIKDIFIERYLSEDDKLIKKNVLKKRWDLMQEGFHKDDIKIRNLKIYLTHLKPASHMCDEKIFYCF